MVDREEDRHDISRWLREINLLAVQIWRDSVNAVTPAFTGCTEIQPTTEAQFPTNQPNG